MNIGVWFAVAIGVFIAIYYGNKVASINKN
jgi:hypothetical protein